MLVMDILDVVVVVFGCGGGGCGGGCGGIGGGGSRGHNDDDDVHDDKWFEPHIALSISKLKRPTEGGDTEMIFAALSGTFDHKFEIFFSNLSSVVNAVAGPRGDFASGVSVFSDFEQWIQGVNFDVFDL